MAVYASSAWATRDNRIALVPELVPLYDHVATMFKIMKQDEMIITACTISDTNRCNPAVDVSTVHPTRRLLKFVNEDRVRMKNIGGGTGRTWVKGSIICDTMADILSEMNFAINTATDGYKAIELVKAHDYTLTLMDMRMPGIYGLERLKRVRQVRPSFNNVSSSLSSVNGGFRAYDANYKSKLIQCNPGFLLERTKM
jgi:hypothetical protein